ncbi:MAG: HNH endonuclease [Actinobacteria bacterium]|nr:HNH endonuclease [Actinomycetota bacterium]
MSRALVLNATYEPLSVVAGCRAVVLVLADKADLVHESDVVLHSERLAVAVPSVVRLRHLVRVPYERRVALSRRGVFIRDGHSCQYCGAAAETLDHVVPRSRGGGHTWENVVAACRRCNLRKGDRLLDEAGLALHRRPVPARPDAWVLTSVGHVPADWQPYLRAA